MDTADHQLEERRLARAISARMQAESLLEQKSLQLYEQAQEREQAVLALRESEERYRLLVELSPDAILIEIDGFIVFANAAAQTLFFATRPEDLFGRSLVSLMAPASRTALAHILQQNESSPAVEDQAVRLDDTLVDVAVTRIAFIYRGEPAIQMIARDISDRKRLEKQLLYQATHDTLTGLANRNLMRERLNDAIVYASRYDQAVWVLFLDLDRFKFFNDSLGHKAGDMLLKEIAARLRAGTRETDTVARLGGDEFVVILPERTREVLAVAALQRLMDAIARPMHLDGKEISVTCSVGLAIYPTDGDAPDTLLEHADIAMYRAKDGGRNNFQFFTADMHEEVRERILIEDALRTALERDEFFLHYQPQVRADTHQIVGIETLIRWRHPELGIVAPNRFISIAEETGLIVPIGAWVLRTACLQNKAWQSNGLGQLRMAVNLSARQFAHADFVQSVADILAETGLEPHCLELELTESLIMSDVDHAIEKLHALKALGIKLSIDDFGTGYSSLSYLKRFPIDVLKIDQAFVRDIAVDPDDAAIVLSIISLAHNLNLRVIAEGVETREQVDYLRAHGCDEMQGYLFSPPVTREEFEQILASERRRDSWHADTSAGTAAN